MHAKVGFFEGTEQLVTELVHTYRTENF